MSYFSIDNTGRPNHAASGNGAITLMFHAGRSRRAVSVQRAR